MDKKIGIYLCAGCEIGESIELEKLTKVATGEYKIPICKTHAALCGQEGATIIRKDIESEGVNTIVIGACSFRAKTDVFNFGPDKILERVNLREHVVWSHARSNEDTQMLAEDYLRMGIVKAQKSLPSEPQQEELDRTILVVGGGVAGMTSAIEAARAGYKVNLVEKERLGGWKAKLHKVYPKSPPYKELEDPGVDALIKKVRSSENISIHEGAEIEAIVGAPCKFDVKLKNSPVTFKSGAIIQATGWMPYDARKLGVLGYGAYPDVITSVELEEMAKGGKIRRPSDGKVPSSVLFIQCAGSRDPEHLPYCSSVCCLTTLKQAAYLREQSRDTKVYIIYKDMRTPGLYEDFYKAMQEDTGVFMTKGNVKSVGSTGAHAGAPLQVDVADTLLGENIRLTADMVVLAVGMVPRSADGPAIRALIDAHAVVVKNESETQVTEAKKKIELLKQHEGTSILNLDYRQGPDLPVLQYGFPDSHFICFPYETQRTGIYVAGALHAPMDSSQAAEDATGAALKAIQCIEQTVRGYAVHPRTWDNTFPEFFLQRCTQCKRCTEECPFGVLNEDVKGTPLPNPTRCRRCAVCMGACPERIISFKNYSVDMIASMIKAIEVPEEDEEKPRVLALFCENDAYPALDMVGEKRIQIDPMIRVIPLRCLGSTNIVWIADALSKGIDGILLVGCKYGDDYQCHYIKGSELANRRMENVQETLQKLALERERVQLTQLSISEIDKLPQIMNEFAEKIKEMDPNPYKGF